MRKYEIDRGLCWHREISNIQKFCGTTSYDLISDVPENSTNLHVNAQNQNELSAKSHCWRLYGFLTGRNESACLTFSTRRVNPESLAITGNKTQREHGPVGSRLFFFCVRGSDIFMECIVVSFMGRAR